MESHIFKVNEQKLKKVKKAYDKFMEAVAAVSPKAGVEGGRFRG